MTLQELWQLLLEALPIMGKGVVWTLYLSGMAMLLGAVIGVCVAVIRVAQVPLLNLACQVYVSCMRGTPLLVQLFVLYYGLPSIGVQLEPLTAGILGLGMNVGAYLSESLRGALQGIDHGQWLAAQSLGMRRVQVLRSWAHDRPPRSEENATCGDTPAPPTQSLVAKDVMGQLMRAVCIMNPRPRLPSVRSPHVRATKRERYPLARR